MKKQVTYGYEAGFSEPTSLRCTEEAKVVRRRADTHEPPVSGVEPAVHIGEHAVLRGRSERLVSVGLWGCLGRVLNVMRRLLRRGKVAMPPA